jgi:cyclic beta-1,2-glucan synthetase
LIVSSGANRRRHHGSAVIPSRRVVQRRALEEHARSLAIAQPVIPGRSRGHPLARRLANNGAVLLHAYRVIAGAVDERRALTPAADWLVDNYYLVERQIREVRASLPPGYYRQLPKLADGPFAGYPRVFGLA